MITKKTLSIVLASGLSFATFAEPISQPILSSQGGASNYLLLTTRTNSKQFQLTGKVNPDGYYVIPKAVKVKATLSNNNQTLDFFFPAPGRYEDADPTQAGLDRPAGIPEVSQSSLTNQINVELNPEFIFWLKARGTSLQVSFRARNEYGYLDSTEKTFSIDQFKKAAKDCFHFGQNTFIRVIRTDGSFSGEDLKTALQYFSFRVSGIIIKVIPRTASFSFPDVSVLGADASAGLIPFYRAYDQIDQSLSGIVSADENMKGLVQAIDENDWKRDFLEAAYQHYYQDSSQISEKSANSKSCGAYRVKLRNTFKAESYSKDFYQAEIGQLPIRFEIGGS